MLFINILLSSPQMPRSKKRGRQLKGCREKKRQKREHALEQGHQEACKERVRNIGLDPCDDEEALYCELMLDEFGKAMQDVFEIFKADDDYQEHRTATSRAAIETERPKKPSNRLAETLRTQQRRSSSPIPIRCKQKASP